MGIWTFNDIRSRSRDWLAILLACTLVLIFPIVGLILYLLIRPKETLAEVYDRALEEEALLRELEHSPGCHNCGSPIKDEWVYCATCHTQLQHSCATCGSLVRDEWAICVICGTPQQADVAPPTSPGFSEPTFSEATPLQEARRRENPFTRPVRTSE